MSKHQENSRNVLAAIVSELASVEAKLNDFNRRSLHIIQYGLLLVGVAIFSAQENIEALAIIPIFWNIWLLYAITVDRDTRKCVIYAEHLEQRANEVMATLSVSEDGTAHRGVFGYRLALRGHGSNLIKKETRGENIAHIASMVIWMLLILLSTVVASVVLAHRHWILPVVLLIYQAFVVFAFFRANHTHKEHAANFQKRLEEAAGGP